MWYQIITITTLAITSDCHTPKNNSDVIVTYAGHAEANVETKFEPKPIPEKPETTSTTEHVKIMIPESYTAETTPFFEDDTESVVFVPNEKPVFRNDDYRADRMSIGDIVMRKSVGDILSDKNIRVASESPNEQILFISGKNSEHADNTRRKETAYEPRTSAKETKKIGLDCSNLDCNNTLKSVCGGKMEHKTWRYRLFLNECYFRKVNCGFKYEVNRFRVMPDELCKPIGSHHSERPFVYNPPLPILPVEKPVPVVMRRSPSSRRSLNLEIDGSFCSHPCPTTCPDDYSPECAVTTKGQRKMFVNHCKLDFNSCSYGTVWHRRPLSECVGNKKADLRQNRAFIGWMQRIGIVDSKGRLVMA
ncbi:uncharacterized protein LOC135085139 [Ostrinia nubilalis]|uniref:uncharacterized protein LOC135085139 n=1 Tax=Ostrinia nubilalis TaxID=29057 RepID=UPI0030822540